VNLGLVVMRKEMLENARDRRAIISTLVFGPLFGPLLFAVMINIAVSRNISSIEEPLKVPIIGVEHAQNLAAFLNARGIEPAQDHGLSEIEAAADAVRRRDQNLVIVFDPDFAETFGTSDTARVALVFDQSNSAANSSVQRARRALSAYAQQLAALRLLARGVHPNVLRPLAIDEYDVSTPAGRSTLLLGMLTYFLLFATLMGGLYLAIDTTAGERERKTLEPLLATPISRATLLLGKMAATIAYMWLSLALTLATFTVAVRVLPFEQLGMSSGFDVLAAFKALLVLAPFAPFGAALMMLVASFTKSYREAQTYLGVIMLVPTLPVMFAAILNVQASPALMWIPSLSQHLLVTNLIRQEPVQITMFAISMFSTLLLGAALAAIAIRLYKREALLG